MGGDRFFRAALAQDLAQSLDTQVAPVLTLPGMVASEALRLNQVQVYGVDERFASFWSSEQDATMEGIVLSSRVAERLNAKVGDSVLLRWERPSLMPQGAALTPTSERSEATRLRVQAIWDDQEGGRFGLQASQVAPLNVFVPLDWLSQRLERAGQANLLLIGSTDSTDLNAALVKCWQAEDAGLSLMSLPSGDWQLQSQRVFIDEVLAEAAQTPEASSSLTYFINELRHDPNATPYSMVAALQPGQSFVPENMGQDEILVNQWLADDLGVTVGDSVTLSYWVMGTGRQLNEQSRDFRVREVLPMSGPVIDPNLMPDFTGLADMEDCADWEPGIPVDLNKIRPKDEAYWDDYRGTPKAFVTLAAGQDMWANAYGNVTAIRYPAQADPNAIARNILSTVSPGSLGLTFRPVQDLGNRARAGGTDFGGLFLGLSMFLIGACLLLIGLLFVLGVESRHEQIGVLSALGWPRGKIRLLFVMEGLVVALLGATLGTGVGCLYTQAMLWGLQNLWQGAVNHTVVAFAITPKSLAIGWASGWNTSVLAMVLVLRKQVSLTVRELLTGIQDESLQPGKRRPWALIMSVLSLAGAMALIVMAHGQGSGAVSGAFFGAGTLLLIGFLLAARLGLKSLGTRSHSGMASIKELGWRNATRRVGRSVAVIGLLAFGTFVVVAVGANRQNPMAHVQQRSSGTGGFALYGESTISLLDDLNASDIQNKLGLAPDVMANVDVLGLTVHDGDDASCLNLNRAQQPRLLGVDADQLASLGAFSFNQQIDGASGLSGWQLLQSDLDPNTIAVIGDYPTVYWGLGKRLGDDLEVTDQRGRPFKLKIVAMINSSILQGSLMMAQEPFEALFPDEVGSRAFLIDCPQAHTAQVVETLSERLVDQGLVVTSTAQRLADFAAVENTYLSIFTALGGLGLILGTLGLGLVVLRNVLERRSELALLRAVGFEMTGLRRLVVAEHAALLVLGLFGGVLCALVAVTPALQNAHGQLPLFGLALTLLAIGLCGWACVDWAARVALRGPILDALRNE